MSIATGRKDGNTPKRTSNYENEKSNDVQHQQLPEVETDWGISGQDARPLLPKASFFLGDLRDGLPMVCYVSSTPNFQGRRVVIIYSVCLQYIQFFSTIDAL